MHEKTIKCHGFRVELTSKNLPSNGRYNTSGECAKLHAELTLIMKR